MGGEKYCSGVAISILLVAPPAPMFSTKIVHFAPVNGNRSILKRRVSQMATPTPNSVPLFPRRD